MTSQHSFGRWPRELYWRWESRWPPPSRRDSSLRLRHRLAAAAASSSGGEVLLVLSTHTHDKQRRLVGHRGRRLAGAAAGRRGRCSRRSHAHRCLSCHRLHRRLRVRRAARPANGRARERKRDGGGLSPAKPKDRMNQHRWPVCTRGCASQVAMRHRVCEVLSMLGANPTRMGGGDHRSSSTTCTWSSARQPGKGRSLKVWLEFAKLRKEAQAPAPWQPRQEHRNCNGASGRLSNRHCSLRILAREHW